MYSLTITDSRITDYEAFLAPDLTDLADQIHDWAGENNRTDGLGDHFPNELATLYPEDWADDEDVTPAPITAEFVEALANTIFDIATAGVVEYDNDDFGIAEYAIDHLDMEREAAKEATEEYISQIEALENRTIDRDFIAPEDAVFIVESIRTSQDSVTVNPLDDVAEAAANLASTTETLENILHSTIRRAVRAGAPIAQVAVAAGLSRPSIYKIIGK